jgi:hypothetical protein
MQGLGALLQITFLLRRQFIVVGSKKIEGVDSVKTEDPGSLFVRLEPPDLTLWVQFKPSLFCHNDKKEFQA